MAAAHPVAVVALVVGVGAVAAAEDVGCWPLIAMVRCGRLASTIMSELAIGFSSFRTVQPNAMMFFLCIDACVRLYFTIVRCS